MRMAILLIGSDKEIIDFARDSIKSVIAIKPAARCPTLTVMVRAFFDVKDPSQATSVSV